MSRRFPLSLLLGALLTTTSCADPPDREIQQAHGAIDAAKAVGADRYAPDEFSAAQGALARANDAVTQHDYRLALHHALEARERAQSAARQAADRRAVARGQAERSMAGATVALQEARARLKAAEASGVPARTLTNARRTIAGADEALQKTRAAFAEADYLAATDTGNAALQQLQEVVRALQRALPPSGRRRR